MMMFMYKLVVRQENGIARGCFPRFSSESSELGRTGRNREARKTKD
jgi:hypothetical protein